MRIFKGILVLMATSAMFVQCKKSGTVNTPGGPGGGGGGGTTAQNYLSSVKYSHNSNDSLVYLRNSSHQVTQVNVYDENGQMLGYEKLTYSNNKLSRVDLYDTTGSSNVYFTYTNAVGQLTQKHFIAGVEDYRYVYVLGPYGKPKSATYFKIMSGDPVQEDKYVYTYDAKTNNVIKTEHYDSAGSITNTSKYTYDGKKNGFANLPADDPTNVELFNVNNITKIDFTNSQGIPSSITYDYTYGTDGYPKSRHSSNNDGVFFHY